MCVREDFVWLFVWLFVCLAGEWGTGWLGFALRSMRQEEERTSYDLHNLFDLFNELIM
jgi:hypothetical protein